MPSIKDFEKKKKAQEVQKNSEVKKVKKQASSISEDQDMETPKRRPSKEETPVTAKEPETIVSEELTSNDTIEEHDAVNADNAAGTEENHHVHIEFPGSFILRSKFEKTFETLDKVATDWVYDGDFEGLQVGHPLLQIAAAKSLKKAKELEKKAQTTQAYALAKIGFEYAKAKLKK